MVAVLSEETKQTRISELQDSLRRLEQERQSIQSEVSSKFGTVDYSKLQYDRGRWKPQEKPAELQEYERRLKVLSEREQYYKDYLSRVESSKTPEQFSQQRMEVAQERRSEAASLVPVREEAVTKYEAAKTAEERRLALRPYEKGKAEFIEKYGREPVVPLGSSRFISEGKELSRAEVETQLELAFLSASQESTIPKIPMERRALTPTEKKAELMTSAAVASFDVYAGKMMSKEEEAVELQKRRLEAEGYVLKEVAPYKDKVYVKEGVSDVSAMTAIGIGSYVTKEEYAQRYGSLMIVPIAPVSSPNVMSAWGSEVSGKKSVGQKIIDVSMYPARKALGEERLEYAKGVVSSGLEYVGKPYEVMVDELSIPNLLTKGTAGGMMRYAATGEYAFGLTPEKYETVVSTPKSFLESKQSELISIEGGASPFVYYGATAVLKAGSTGAGIVEWGLKRPAEAVGMYLGSSYVFGKVAGVLPKLSPAAYTVAEVGITGGTGFLFEKPKNVAEGFGIFFGSAATFGAMNVVERKAGEYFGFRSRAGVKRSAKEIKVEVGSKSFFYDVGDSLVFREKPKFKVFEDASIRDVMKPRVEADFVPVEEVAPFSFPKKVVASVEQEALYMRALGEAFPVKQKPKVDIFKEGVGPEFKSALDVQVKRGVYSYSFDVSTPYDVSVLGGGLARNYDLYGRGVEIFPSVFKSAEKFTFTPSKSSVEDFVLVPTKSKYYFTEYGDIKPVRGVVDLKSGSVEVVSKREYAKRLAREREIIPRSWYKAYKARESFYAEKRMTQVVGLSILKKSPKYGLRPYDFVSVNRGKGGSGKLGVEGVKIKNVESVSREGTVVLQVRKSKSKQRLVKKKYYGSKYSGSGDWVNIEYVGSNKVTERFWDDLYKPFKGKTADIINTGMNFKPDVTDRGRVGVYFDYNIRGGIKPDYALRSNYRERYFERELPKFREIEKFSTKPDIKPDVGIKSDVKIDVDLREGLRSSLKLVPKLVTVPKDVPTTPEPEKPSPKSLIDWGRFTKEEKEGKGFRVDFRQRKGYLPSLIGLTFGVRSSKKFKGSTLSGLEVRGV